MDNNYSLSLKSILLAADILGITINKYGHWQKPNLVIYKLQLCYFLLIFAIHLTIAEIKSFYAKNIVEQ